MQSQKHAMNGRGLLLLFILSLTVYSAAMCCASGPISVATDINFFFDLRVDKFF